MQLLGNSTLTLKILIPWFWDGAKDVLFRKYAGGF